MGKTTGISWTHHTFNPWQGCTKVSSGCDNCYAETMDARYGGNHWGKGVERREMSDKHWNGPVLWNRDAGEAKEVRNVFCGSMCDVMDDEAPAGARERLWQLIDKTPNLFWQLLTKRPHRYVKYLPLGGFAHDNVILMATVESQEFYKERIKALYNGASTLENNNSWRGEGRERGAVMTGVSYEPALGPLSIREYPGMRPNWVIFGGETGSKPRPMERAWADNIKAECEEFGVAFFMKQFSASTPTRAKDLIPAELLIRQFPGKVA